MSAINWLPYTYIPLLGIFLLPLGVIFSDKTKFVGTTTIEYIKVLTFGIMAVIILIIPIFFAINNQFF